MESALRVLMVQAVWGAVCNFDEMFVFTNMGLLFSDHLPHTLEAMFGCRILFELEADI